MLFLSRVSNSVNNVCSKGPSWALQTRVLIIRQYSPDVGFSAVQDETGLILLLRDGVPLPGRGFRLIIIVTVISVLDSCNRCNRIINSVESGCRIETGLNLNADSSTDGSVSLLNSLITLIM